MENEESFGNFKSAHRKMSAKYAYILLRKVVYAFVFIHRICLRGSLQHSTHRKLEESKILFTTERLHWAGIWESDTGKNYRGGREREERRVLRAEPGPGCRDLIDQDPGSGGEMPRERAGLPPSPPPPANPAISSSKKDSAWLSENNITDNFQHLELNKHPRS